jgi:signal transduction histidine kinase
VLILSFIIAYNRTNAETILALSSILIVSVSIRYLLLYESSRLYKWGIVSILTDAVIVYFISGIDKYAIVELYYPVLIGDLIIFYPFLCGIVIILLSYLIFLIITYNSNKNNSFKEFLPNISTSLLSIIFIVVIMSILKYLINQHTRLKIIMEELKVANLLLTENSVQLEQMVLIKERNRIASEVHDTVGHTLTTVLVEIEAGKRILKKDPDMAFYKLELAQEQVRKGLDDIIQSIKTIRNEAKLPDNFKTAFENIIQETELHTGVKVNCDIMGIQSIPANIQEVLCRALKEGLTNGIRHGKCDEFSCILKSEEGFIIFILEDNGCGCNQLEYGFGLKAMKKRVDLAGGFIEVESEQDSGCKLKISLPYREEQAYE